MCEKIFWFFVRSGNVLDFFFRAAFKKNPSDAARFTHLFSEQAVKDTQLPQTCSAAGEPGPELEAEVKVNAEINSERIANAVQCHKLTRCHK